MPAVFFSYSHRDEALRNELEAHLSLMKRQGIVTTWHDRRIGAGDDIHRAIDSHLDDCEIVLLLVSAQFLASDYCYERELARALERHRDGRSTVIPVILHPCDWHSAPFGDLRATPTDGKPVSMFANQDEAMAIVAADVRKAAMRYVKNGVTSPPSAARPADGEIDRGGVGERSSNLRVRRRFSDQEKDTFLEETFEYIARFFESSLQELAARNPQLKARYSKLDARSFSASIYEDGRRAAQCSVWHGTTPFANAIVYSNSADGPGNSYNESLSVEGDGFDLFLKPLGMAVMKHTEDALGKQGAAEHLWALLLGPLQER